MQQDAPLSPAKPWWKSTTIWGIVVTAVMGVVSSIFLKVGIDPSTLPAPPANADYDQLKGFAQSFQQVAASKGGINELMPILLVALPAIWAIWGRVKTAVALTTTTEQAVIQNVQVTEAKSLLAAAGKLPAAAPPLKVVPNA